MSERGQRIFKWIVWITIFLAAIIYIVILVRRAYVAEPEVKVEEEVSITRADWAEMLAEGFGNPELQNNISEGEVNTTGEYAAISAISAFGDQRIKYLSELKHLSSTDSTELAVAYNIINRDQLEKELFKSEAEQIILNALDVYFDPAYYPQYFEAETKVDCINADRWDVSEFDEENNTIIASIDEKPEKGSPIIYTDEYGIARAKYVQSVKESGEGNYKVQLTEVEDISEILDSVSFSGSADFSYLKETDDMSGQNSEDGTESTSIKNPFVITAYAAEPDPVLLAEWDWFEDQTALKKENSDEDVSKCDIEINVEMKDIDKNGNDSQKVTAYIKITADGVSRKFKYEIDDSGKESLNYTEESEGFSLDFSKNDGKGFQDDSGYGKAEAGVAANVKITGLTVCTSGYYQWADPDDSKNYVEVLASADKINLSTSEKISGEIKKKIGSLPLPIASTGGVIVVNLNVYLVVSASGELSLWYEIDDPYAGINVSVANGVQTPHGKSNEDAGMKAKIEVSGGLIGEAAVMVFDCDLADPSIDVRAYGSASTIDVKDKYEFKPEYIGNSCVELKAQAPIIKLKATAGEDSLLYFILDTLKVEASYDLIKKDSDSVPWVATYHVEEDSDGTVRIIKLENGDTHEDVCTHIQLKEPEEEDDLLGNLEDKVDEEVDKKKKEAQSKLEKALEDALDKWLEENCGGCF